MTTFSGLLALCAGNSLVQWRGVLMRLWSAPEQTFEYRDTGQLRRHRTRYDVIVVFLFSLKVVIFNCHCVTWWCGSKYLRNLNKSCGLSNTNLPSPSYQGPILITLIPAWKTNHMPSKMWDGISNLFANFNGPTVAVWEGISPFWARHAIYEHSLMPWQ